MRVTKSKLEVYEDVLRILSAKPLTLDGIAFEGNMDCMLLQQKMNFLLEHGLVEEVTFKEKTVYLLTSRGAAVFKTLTLTKRLEDLQSNIAGTVESLPVQAFPSENGKPKRKL
jgi:predicted transcriptional regulator